MSLDLVLRNRPDIAERWSADKIALRWCRVLPPRDDATGKPVEPGIHDLAMLVNHSERLAKCDSVSPTCHGSCSSRRRGERARSSMRRRAARGAGSRARRRLEPPLCRPLARRRAVNRHLHYAFLKGRGHPALNSLPGPSRHRQANRSTSHVKRSRTKTTVVSIRSASDRLETQRLDAQVDCSYRRFLGCLDSARLPGTNRDQAASRQAPEHSRVISTSPPCSTTRPGCSSR